nr:transposase [Yersinia frederiksenii]
MRALYPVKMLCQIFGVHRSSYRHWRGRPDEPDAERIIKRSQVREAWNASGGSAGARSIATIVTAKHSVKMSRWLAGKLMKELGIASCQIPAHKYKRGSSEHVEIPHLLDRQFAVTAPNQVWCGDVTYIWTGKRWAYLAVVLDLFARKPVGWAIELKDLKTGFHGTPGFSLFGHRYLRWHKNQQRRPCKKELIPGVIGRMPNHDRRCVPNRDRL